MPQFSLTFSCRYLQAEGLISMLVICFIFGWNLLIVSENGPTPANITSTFSFGFACCAIRFRSLAQRGVKYTLLRSSFSRTPFSVCIVSEVLSPTRVFIFLIR